MGGVSRALLPPPRPDRPRVLLDLVPIHPGRRGAGGGIWSYASALARELEALDPPEVEIVFLVNPWQRLEVARSRQLVAGADTRSPIGRLRWIHAELPSVCRHNGVALLHKLATEVPWWPGGCRLVTTVHDFMAEHYGEHRAAMAGGVDGALSRSGGRRTAGRILHDSYFRAVTARCFARSDALIAVSHAVATEAGRRFPRASSRLRVVPQGLDDRLLTHQKALTGEPGLPEITDAPDAAATPGMTDVVDVPHAPRPADALRGGPAVAGRSAPAATRTAGARLLVVGALLPHKGHINAMGAAAALASGACGARVPVSLTLHGHAPDPAFELLLRETAARLPADVDVSLRHYDPELRGAALYRGADVLLQLSSYEGFGLPPLEAQAAGIPVVCSDIPIFREILGEGALFVDREDPAAVAAAVSLLLEDAERRRTLVERGRTNAASYRWARTARDTLAVYREVLGGDRPAR